MNEKNLKMIDKVQFIHKENGEVLYIIKNGAIVHKPEITLDYLYFIDEAITSLINHILHTYNISNQIEYSKQLTGLLELKGEIL